MTACACDVRLGDGVASVSRPLANVGKRSRRFACGPRRADRLIVDVQYAATPRTAACERRRLAPRRNPHAAEARRCDAARRPLGTLTNTQPAAAPPKPAPKPAVYRCDHCFSFTGSYAAVAAHEATCPCAAPSIKREAATPPPAAPAPKRRVPLWVLVCFLWAGYEAARPIPQPVCPARRGSFDGLPIEQLADVAASESTALVVHEEVGYGVAGKLGNAASRRFCTGFVCCCALPHDVSAPLETKIKTLQPVRARCPAPPPTPTVKQPPSRHKESRATPLCHHSPLSGRDSSRRSG